MAERGREQKRHGRGERGGKAVEERSLARKRESERDQEELVNYSRACNARTSQASELNQKILCSKG